MRGFDFEVILEAGPSTMFSGADKDELENLMKYFEKGGVLVKTISDENNFDDEIAGPGEYGDEEMDEADSRYGNGAAGAGQMDIEEEEDDSDYQDEDDQAEMNEGTGQIGA